MTVFLFVLLLLFNSPQSQANWQSVETTRFKWGKTDRLYTLILEKRDDKYRLRIETFGHADFVWPIANEVVRLDNQIINQTLVADKV